MIIGGNRDKIVVFHTIVSLLLPPNSPKAVFPVSKAFGLEQILPTFYQIWRSPYTSLRQAHEIRLEN